jgi:hypothetical protein
MREVITGKLVATVDDMAIVLACVDEPGLLSEPLAQLIQEHLERNRSLPVTVPTAAFQPRSKVGIGNVAVNDLSFG